MNLQRLYINSPNSIKKIAGALLRPVPRQFIYGRLYGKTLDKLKIYEFLPLREIEIIQLQKLKSILNHAYHFVPYYKSVFENSQINVDDIQSFKDFMQIPFLDKSIIKKNLKQLVAQNFDKNKIDYGTTGGTSGEPLGFYMEKRRSSIEWAYMTHIWRRIGFQAGDKRLVLRGEVIKKSSKLHFYDPLLNQLSLSTFHMTDENLPRYLKLINNFKPHVIHGYPSAITTLAQYIYNNNIHFPIKLKGIIGISENIIDAQRAFIEKVFKARLFSFYGHSEKLILAANCEYSNTYHIEPMYGYAEVIDADGNPVTDPGEKGELVGTSFFNNAMPFIRYRTGDIVRIAKNTCQCGRHYMILDKIEGRWHQEMLVTKDNSLISITSLNMHSDIFDRVKRFQFEQYKPGEVVLKIARNHNYTDQDSKKILNALNKKIDKQIDISINFVDTIPTTKIGKSLFLQQNIKIDQNFSL